MHHSVGVRVEKLSVSATVFTTFWTIQGKPMAKHFEEHEVYRAEVRPALLPRLFGTNPRSHHKGATGRVRTGDQWLPVLCHCQLGQDIPTPSAPKQWKTDVHLKGKPVRARLPLTKFENLEEKVESIAIYKCAFKYTDGLGVTQNGPGSVPNGN